MENKEFGKRLEEGTILVVDDTPSTLGMIRTALGNAGYEVLVATNGEKALKRATSTLPDLILLDIIMPGMDGYETCQRLKAHEKTKAIPVIFLSALEKTFDKVKDFEVGAVDYVTKPIETAELLARVRTHLTIHRLQQELQEMNATLEEKVQARTAELSRANEVLTRVNEVLQAKIQERKRVEKMIVHAKQEWERTFDAASEMIMILDREYRIVRVNETMAKRFGVAPAAMIGQPCYTYFHGSQEPPSFCPHTQLLADGRKHTAEIHGEQLSGDLLLSVSPIFDADGQLISSVHIVYDITERKRAEVELRKYREHLEELVEKRTAELQKEIEERKRTEEALRVNEERLSLAARIGNLAMWEFYLDTGKIVETFFNDKWLEITGLTREEMENFSLDAWFSKIHSDDRERSREKLQAHFRGETERVENELRIWHPQKGWRWLYAVARAIERDVEGKSVRLVGLHQDITERKRAEQALRDSQQQLQTIIDSVQSVIFIKDLESRYVMINKTYEQAFGVKKADVIGKTGQAIFPPEVAAQLRENDRKVMASGKPVTIEESGILADGRLHVYLSNKVPLLDEHGKVYGLCGFGTEITQQKDLEKELREARNTAEAANRAKSEFLANMSHELRTPLNAIIGFSQLLSHRPNLDTEQQDYLTIINRSGEHLLTLINQVLDLSKIEAGRMMLEESNFDLHHLLDDLEDLFRMRAEKKHLHLSFDRTPNVPQYVQMDEVKLRQVLINLLSNAIKFTKKGDVMVYVKVRSNRFSDSPTPAPSQEGKTRSAEALTTNLRFDIEDTGPGIAPDEIDRLFSAFTQTKTGQETREGTGLGLTISQRFVQLMGGKISVTSEVGEGSVFTITLPVHMIDAADVISSPAARRVVALAPDQPRYRVLIVDDNQHSRRLLVSLLTPIGFELREAKNGRDALEIWEQWEPHVIFMDMRMPVMDGYEATKQIRKSEIRNPKSEIRPVIIALTASAFEEDRSIVLSAGCDNFLGKPFQESDLFELLHKHLDVRYVYEEGERSKVESRKSKVKEVLTPTALAGLPSDLLASLEQATLYCDTELIEQVIDKIRSHDSTLANALARLANSFDYDGLLKVIREVKNYKD